ncbi:hypothetical protein [Bythopirellula polymerisocia]|uniref:hypothetical protein n=1 Tax=Bythopirellula polymerisocia TaxID=2528003 RepID=UPI0011B73DD1|nr:hypothetical protein [Bythopirellula polymerisocia]
MPRLLAASKELPGKRDERGVGTLDREKLRSTNVYVDIQVASMVALKLRQSGSISRGSTI